MATVIEEFVARLGWDVDTKKVNEFNKSFESVKKIALGIGKAVSIASGLITGYATVVGRQIAVNTNLARSVGITVESLEALGGVVENIGLETDNVVDLVEEMNNKLGEKKGLGEFTAVEESLKILKLDFKEIQKMKPEDQFIKILDAAKDLGDQQQAASAVDMLMGGEANKILGFLRTQDGSLAQLIERRKQLILLDQEGRKGAVDFAASMNDLNFIMKSMGGLIFGELGKVLRPMIQNFIEWAAANRDIIRTRIKDFASGLGKILKVVFRIVKTFVTWIWEAVEAVGGLDKALFILGLTLGGLMLGQAITAIRSFMAAVKAATLAQTLLNISVAAIPALIALAVVAIGLLAEDLYQFFTGGESLFGDFVDTVQGTMSEMSKILETAMDEATAFWANQFGMTEDEFRLMLVGMLEPLESFINEVDKQILAIFTYFENFSGGFGDFISGIIDKAIGLFRELKAVAKDNIGAVLKFARGLPLIGGLFGGGDITAGGASSPGPGPSGSVVNNSGRTTNIQSTTVTAPINVTAAPGQSAEEIGREVRKQLGEQMSTAVRNNDTGIER